MMTKVKDILAEYYIIYNRQHIKKGTNWGQAFKKQIFKEFWNIKYEKN